MKEKYYFEKFPQLESDRLILKEILPEEAKYLVGIAVYDQKVSESVSDVLKIQDKINKDFENGDSIIWGIHLKETGKLIGNCGFSRGYKDQIGEIGYVLHKDFRGHNYMKEAVETVTAFGLRIMKLSKIIAYTKKDNLASQKVLEGNGYNLINSEEYLTFEKRLITDVISKDTIDRLRETVKRRGRQVDYLMIEHLFSDRSTEIIEALKAFQNEDGGFGNALEPDLRVPDSSAVATEFAINILDRLNDVDAELIKKIVNYLEGSFNHIKGYWEIAPKTVDNYPRAVWWNADGLEGFGRHNPSASLLGFLYKYKNYVTKLDVDALIKKLIDEVLELPVEAVEAHTIFCLMKLEEHLTDWDTSAFRNKINDCILFTVELHQENWASYSPEPIKYITNDQHELYEVITSSIHKNLDYLIESMTDECVWEPKHTWHQFEDVFNKTVKDEWMGIFTYDHLKRLISFNRVEM